MTTDKDTLIDTILNEIRVSQAMEIEEQKTSDSENEMEEEHIDNIPSLSYIDVMNVLEQLKIFPMINEPNLRETSFLWKENS